MSEPIPFKDSTTQYESLLAALQEKDREIEHLQKLVTVLEQRAREIRRIAEIESSELKAAMKVERERAKAEIERRLGGFPAEVSGPLDNELRVVLGELRLVAAWHRKILRPVHWLWIKLLPVRRIVARIRRRV
jgi:predicted ATPase